MDTAILLVFVYSSRTGSFLFPVSLSSTLYPRSMIDQAVKSEIINKEMEFSQSLVQALATITIFYKRIMSGQMNNGVCDG